MSSYQATGESPEPSVQFIEDINASGTRHSILLGRTVLRCVELFENNTGLLLIALSQAFTSLMGVFVKMLNATEHPGRHFAHAFADGPSAHLGAHGPDVDRVRFIHDLRERPGSNIGTQGHTLAINSARTCGFRRALRDVLHAAVFIAVGYNCAFVLDSHVHRDYWRTSPQGRPHCEAINGERVALLGVVGLTTAYTTIRAIGKRAHPMHNLAAFALVCIVAGPIAMLVSRTPVLITSDILTVVLVLAVSLCGFGAQITMTTGLQRETAGRGTLAIYVQVVFAMLFERIFFHTVPSFLSLLGTIIILSSAVYVAFSKRSVEATKIASAASNRDDPMLEEGLLVQHREAESELEGYELNRL